MQTEVLEQLQLAALFHASRGNADAVFSIVDVADFEPGDQQNLASIIVSLMGSGEVTPMAVMDRASKESARLSAFFATRVSEEHYSTPTYCANAVHDAAVRRRVTASVTRAYQALTGSPQAVESVIAELATDLEVLDASIDSGMPVIDFEELMATPDDIRPWVMPGMLRTNERLIITGPEGGGKSVLVAQLTLGAAMGVNSMSADVTPHEPMRVLMLDVENDRLQVKANMRKVFRYMRELAPGVKPQIEWVDVRTIDLSNPVERQKVIRIAKERQPDLMYMGSLYKLAPEGEKTDAQFMHVSRTVDSIRAETGTSILIGAHTGHGMQNDRNGNMRPYGSSMWLRWPEFGMAMVHHRDKPVQIKHWRGARSDERDWPGGLRRGEVLPWVPISLDEWNARYE
jgi:replicative DNA helicase